MTSPIVNPEIPYVAEIPGGLVPGKMCRIQGVTHPNADRFNINLAVGESTKPRDDTGLHISVRLNQGYVARNTYKDGSWGAEEDSGKLPIGQAQSWEILILVDQSDYKIAINGQHFCDFRYKVPYSDIKYLLIDGDVTITLISWEGITGIGGAESASKAAELNAELPQGAPPQFAPQAGYGPPPGAYGPPPGPGYGPPPPGYGAPPPPGAHEESGFGDFLEQAQSVLAGAIRTGAAEKILGSLLSSSGGEQRHQGYAPQNAQYGIYPSLPPDLNDDKNSSQNAGRPGPVESLLTSFLGGGNKQTSQQPQQNTQNQSQQTQNTDLVSLLSGLLSSKQQTYSGQQQTNQNSPHNQETQVQGTDLTSVLSRLLSGGSQPQQNVASSNETGSNLQPNQQTQGVDINGLISQLLSGGKEKQMPNAPPSGYTPTQTQTQHQGLDFSGLLTGLLSNSQRPEGHQGSNHSQTASSNQQSGGINLNSLLGSLLSSGDSQNQSPGSGSCSSGYPSQPPYNAGHVSQPTQTGGYATQQVGGSPLPGDTSAQNPPPSSQVQTDSAPSKPASAQPYEDVSDQLAQAIAAEGKSGQQHQGTQSQQYGQYPHPPQQSQAGPVESLLSGLLSGGGGGGSQQPQGSIGGLGSVGGLLHNFAGSLLNPKDPNQRPSY